MGSARRIVKILRVAMKPDPIMARNETLGNAHTETPLGVPNSGEGREAKE